MNHSDGERCVCSECGSEFHFTTAEARFYEERGLNFPPKRCKACRQARKAAPGRGAPPSQGRDSGGYRDSGSSRDSGGFRGPAGYGGGPRNDDRRGPPPRFGQGAPSYGEAPRQGGYGDAPRQGGYGDAPRQGGFDRGARPGGFANAPRPGGFDRGPRPGGFANAPRPGGFDRGPRPGGFDRGPRPEGFRARSNFDAPPPAAYGQERPAQRRSSPNDSAEPRKARVAREKPKFDITCQQCGAHASVPFKPLPGRDIFCPTCYRARKSLSPEERAATSIANTANAASAPIEATTASAPHADPAETGQGTPHEE